MQFLEIILISRKECYYTIFQDFCRSKVFFSNPEACPRQRPLDFPSGSIFLDHSRLPDSTQSWSLNNSRTPFTSAFLFIYFFHIHATHLSRRFFLSTSLLSPFPVLHLSTFASTFLLKIDLIPNPVVGTFSRELFQKNVIPAVISFWQKYKFIVFIDR